MKIFMNSKKQRIKQVDLKYKFILTLYKDWNIWKCVWLFGNKKLNIRKTPQKDLEEFYVKIK